MTKPQAGAAGASGRIRPSVPSVTSFARAATIIDNGQTPRFAWSNTTPTYSSKATSDIYFSETIKKIHVSLWRSSDNEYLGYIETTGTGGTSAAWAAVAGTSYYIKVRATDTVTDLQSDWSAASSSVVAMTRPANVGTVNISTPVQGTINGSWAAVNAGGDPTNLLYKWSIHNNSNGVQYTAGQTYGTSMSVAGVPAGTYYLRVFAETSYAKQLADYSQSTTVTIVAPPFFPFFPSFGPFFPFFPSFGPSFGPSFPRFFY